MGSGCTKSETINQLRRCGNMTGRNKTPTEVIPIDYPGEVHDLFGREILPWSEVDMISEVLELKREAIPVYFTANDVTVVKEIWPSCQENFHSIGMNAFKKIVAECPDVTLPHEKYHQHEENKIQPKIEEHSVSMMYAIDKVVSLLHQDKRIFEYVLQFGASHAHSTSMLSEHHLWLYEVAILEALRDHLGDVQYGSVAATLGKVTEFVIRGTVLGLARERKLMRSKSIVAEDFLPVADRSRRDYPMSKTNRIRIERRSRRKVQMLLKEMRSLAGRDSDQDDEPRDGAVTPNSESASLSTPHSNQHKMSV